uniref:putative group II intron reverse transcriptase/maturase protein n=1 Tax=Synarthrophyton patena TaxID=48972 RepID=UPI0021824908|nr:putative group II intron reverse transcriptase/maturase protein [Synarthrophyton patena]UVF62924.1 putative group II intron reverse transcriptase/maturase protein [Synarthrophyton patena]
MHQEDFSPNLNILVWQSIDWEQLSHYLDNLKSRIYKASIQKSYKKIHDLQYKLINSSLVKLIAFKRAYHEYDHCFIVNSFQLGYFISYFGLGPILDMSIWLSFSHNSVLVSIKEMNLIFDRVTRLIIIWSLEPYFQHLYELNSRSLLQYYNKYTNLGIAHDFNAYYLNLDLTSLFYYIDLYIFINKLNAISDISKYVYGFLDNGIFIGLAYCLYESNHLSTLIKQKICLSNQLIDIFILVICYEINILLKSYMNIGLRNVLVINYFTNILIYCEDYMHLKLWRQAFLDILISNGVKIQSENSLKAILSLQDIGYYCRVINLFSNPFHIAFNPSIYCQYILLKQIAILLKKSKSKVLFLLVVRLNMLLLSWSSLYHTQQVNKVFSLLDYIIYLKLKVLIRKAYINMSKKQIKQKYFPLKFYIFNSFKTNTHWPLNSHIINNNYYKVYSTIKLSWLAC